MYKIHAFQVDRTVVHYHHRHPYHLAPYLPHYDWNHDVFYFPFKEIKKKVSDFAFLRSLCCACYNSFSSLKQNPNQFCISLTNSKNIKRSGNGHFLKGRLVCVLYLSKKLKMEIPELVQFDNLANFSTAESFKITLLAIC